MKKLVATLLDEGWSRNDNMAAVTMMTEAAGLSAEDLAPLMTFLLKRETEIKASAENGTFQGDMTLLTLQGYTNLLTLRWATLDPKAALVFAMGRPEFKDTDTYDELLPSIIYEMAKTDLPAAKAEVSQLKSMQRQEAGRAVVQILQQRDPQAAIAYARELEDSKAEAGVIMHLAAKDPMAAAAELTPEMEGHLEVVESIAGTLLHKDRAAFETWAGSLSDPAQQAEARCAALKQDAALDPAKTAVEAAAWVAKELATPEQARQLSAAIVRKWLETEGQPATVAAWTEGLPEGPGRDAAVKETASAWLEKDTLAASAWLRSLAPSEAKDNIVRQLVINICADTPADAFEWARTIGTPSLRGDSLREAVQSWARQDPAAAGQALEKLPARDRDRLLDIVEAAKEKAAEQK